VHEVLDEYDLTPSYWAMLGVIVDAHDGIRQAEIARTMHVKAPLITPMVHQLESRKIVQAIPNQFDARAKLVSVTPRGKKFTKNVESSINKVLDKLLMGLTKNELIVYRKVLTTIIDNDKTIRINRLKEYKL
jgi:DNA-binding MarR family transcriptional regulator